MSNEFILFDTHTHLNFQTYKKNVNEIIKDSKASGIKYINIVGTDIKTSKKATEIAQKYEGNLPDGSQVYATVGIHPHHIFEHYKNQIASSKIPRNDVLASEAKQTLDQDLSNLEKLVKSENVVAVGETGMDKHIYAKTRHSGYEMNDNFINLQKSAFEAQIKLALKYSKSLSLHNREAVPEFLEVLGNSWDAFFERRAVFHCCEPDQELLDFAIENKIYIGIDGDVTYDKAKQDFVKKIPLDLLVLETDSPFLTPLGLNPPNIPGNLNYICGYISKILKIEKQKLAEITFKNSKKLFNL